MRPPNESDASYQINSKYILSYYSYNSLYFVKIKLKNNKSIYLFISRHAMVANLFFCKKVNKSEIYV